MNLQAEILETPIPGPNSRALAARLAKCESRGVTTLEDPAPIVWASAEDAFVTDVDGNRYVDLTAAFGVAGVGHSNPKVVAAIADQAAILMHGMGDVHPTLPRIELLEVLTAIAPFEDARGFLCSSGSEAVEFALKTAYLSTGGPNALAFGGAYHGLTLGALEVSGNPKFRRPFAAQLRQHAGFVPYPDRREPDSSPRTLERIEQQLRKEPGIGAIIIEPIQGRAGVIIPPKGFLPGLRKLCNEHHILLIFDEIFTGFGRTGTMFACEHEAVEPDLLCLGKAMSAGFPLSAVIGKRAIMDAWEPAHGESIHTSTHLGNPMGCAAALAAIRLTRELHLPERAASLEVVVERELAVLKDHAQVVDIRGRGLLWGIEFADPAFAAAVVARALSLGLILLQSGLRGEIVAISPPLVISEALLIHTLSKLTTIVNDMSIRA